MVKPDLTKVLIVEDEYLIGEIIQGILENMGYQVLDRAKNGREAIAKTKRLQPDVILMDIQLPDMNGIEVTQKIFREHPTPIAILTAYDTPELVEKAAEAGVGAFLIKPPVGRDIERAINISIARFKDMLRLKRLNENLKNTLKNEREEKATILHEKELQNIILRSLGEAVISTDAENRIIMMNKMAEALTGWREEDAIQKPLSEIYRKFIKFNGENKIHSMNEVESASNKQDIVLIAKDGTERLIEEYRSPIIDKQNNRAGSIIVFRDITEKQKFATNLFRTQHLEAIGILAGGIAHDFNNILTAIMGNLSLIKIELPRNAEINQILSDIEKGLIRAKNLARQLLTFSKGGRPQKKPVYLQELIKESLSDFKLNSKVKIEYKIQEGLLKIEADAHQIRQVIENVVKNAQQAMPQGGKITISLENSNISAQDKLPLKEGEYVKTSIADEGSGIPEGILEKIFDPYFTTQKAGGGLGLAITFSIIKRHKGHVQVTSNKNQGTTVTFYLPAMPEINIKTKSIKIVNPDYQQPRILLMDDDPMILKVTSKLLSRLGYNVTVVDDGSKAIAAFQHARQSDQPFAAVIMDLSVPGGMGGTETLEEIKKIDENVRAIISSGYSTDPVLSSFRDFGFTAVINKPYNPGELKATLKKVLTNK